MNKLNVIFFKFSLAFGGGEKHNIELGGGLVNKGNRVRIYTNSKHFLSKILDAGLEGRAMYWGREAGAIRYIPAYFLVLPLNLLRFYTILKKEKVSGAKNIVLFQSLNEKIFASRMAKKMGFSVVWVEHLSIDPWLTRSFFRGGYVRKSKYADKIVAISGIIKKELVGMLGVPDEKVSVIYNGIDTQESLGVDEGTLKKARKEAGLAEEFVIGSVGRLHEEKGYDTLLKAFKIVKEKYSGELRLLFAGDGPDSKRLERISEDLKIRDSVLFLGFRNDIPVVMSMIDIFVLPSKVRESFGIVLIEAMACKKPVIASNLGGIPEIVEDGKNGFLFSPGNTDELAEKILEMIKDKDLYRKISAEAFRTARDKFSIKKTVSDFELLFNSFK